jgi:FtsP/CotA-like multicopper oxidase with cupredoxin domain
VVNGDFAGRNARLSGSRCQIFVAPLVTLLGEKQLWTIVNNSAFDQPFHLHF